MSVGNGVTVVKDDSALYIVGSKVRYETEDDHGFGNAGSSFLNAFRAQHSSILQ